MIDNEKKEGMFISPSVHIDDALREKEAVFH
jgi:hypothetical protein